jgi:hypothetical protein
MKEKRFGKKGLLALGIFLALVLSLSFASAFSFSDFFKKITGQAISEQGFWAKIQTHAHSQPESWDSFCTLDEQVQTYKNLRYNLLSLSEHNLYKDCGAKSDLKNNFLCIGGEERSTGLDTFHMTLLGINKAIKTNNAQKAIDETIKQGGVVFINHPNLDSEEWKNKLNGLKSYLAIDIHKSYGSTEKRNIEFWDSLLAKGMKVFAIAGDDNHCKGAEGEGEEIELDTIKGEKTGIKNVTGQINKGWTKVFVNSFSKKELIKQIKAGYFYASTGVSLENGLEIDCDGNILHMGQAGSCENIKIKAAASSDYIDYKMKKIVLYSNSGNITEQICGEECELEYTMVPFEGENYYRVEAVAVKDNSRKIAVSNPIWITKKITGQAINKLKASSDGFVEIKTVQDLININKNLSGKYRLMNDLDLSGMYWTPIGYSLVPADLINEKTKEGHGRIFENTLKRVIYIFTGVFDGNNYTIKNMKIDMSQSEIYNQYMPIYNKNNEFYSMKKFRSPYTQFKIPMTQPFNSIEKNFRVNQLIGIKIEGPDFAGPGQINMSFELGLFAESCGEIKNLKIESVNITARNGEDDIGIVVSHLIDCRNYTYYANKKEIRFSGKAGNISNCFTSGSVTKALKYIVNPGTNKLIRMESSIAGSIAAINQDSFIENSYSSIAELPNSTYVHVSKPCTFEHTSIKTCIKPEFNYDYCWKRDKWGRIENSIEPCTKGMLNYSYCQDNLIKYKSYECKYGCRDGDCLTEDEFLYGSYIYVDNYPNLKFTEICTPEELLNISNNTGKNFRLVCDIDMSGRTWVPVDWPIRYGSDALSGVFDGNGHVIKNLNIKGKKNVGFFGSMCGVIQNLGLVNVSVNGNELVGGFVGEYCKGGTGRSPRIKNSFVTGTINGNEVVGGLIGRMWGTSYIFNSYVKADVKGNSEVGGLVGGLVSYRNEISNIENSYFDGNVKGSKYTGGIVGGVENMQLSTEMDDIRGEQYWDLDDIDDVDIRIYSSLMDGSYTTATANRELGGKTEEEMKARSNFDGWDFDRIWKMSEGKSPILRWENESLADIGGNYECEPSWQCTSWSACQNRNMIRTCTDLNGCGISAGKPDEKSSCFSNNAKGKICVISGTLDEGFNRAGTNINAKESISLYNTETGQYSSISADKCINSKKLVEYYCKKSGTNSNRKDKIGYKTTTCSNSCLNGACVVIVAASATNYCKQLQDLLSQSYGSQCGNENYDKRIDITNDGKINALDISPLSGNAKNEAWCSEQLNKALNPCA